MTEDDTFRILRRTPFKDICREYNKFCISNNGIFFSSDRTIFFDQHGWSNTEFIRMHQILGIKLPHD